MARPSRPTETPHGSLLRDAVRPAPLVVLAATGVGAAFGGWIVAVGGAVIYAATVGATALRRPRTALTSGPSFAPPSDERPSLKSREVLALAMRIRKAHRALYDGLTAADASVQAILADSYTRIGELVEGTRELATRADRLQLHIDAVRAAGQSPPDLPAIVAQRVATTAELVRVAEAIEAVTPRLLAGSTIEVDDASQVADELAGELRHMKELVDEVALK
ncbi:MAG: hypothetical protein JNL82_11470 [Myxococcales bacterium]|nr:hypothetical protein [Myxococcales bacterium]